MTTASRCYKEVDVDAAVGVTHQVNNFCANNSLLVTSIENRGFYNYATFIDGSNLSFTDYSITVGNLPGEH